MDNKRRPFWSLIRWFWSIDENLTLTCGQWVQNNNERKCTPKKIYHHLKGHFGDWMSEWACFLSRLSHICARTCQECSTSGYALDLGSKTLKLSKQSLLTIPSTKSMGWGRHTGPTYQTLPKAAMVAVKYCSFREWCNGISTAYHVNHFLQVLYSQQ